MYITVSRPSAKKILYLVIKPFQQCSTNTRFMREEIKLLIIHIIFFSSTLLLIDLARVVRMKTTEFQSFSSFIQTTGAGADVLIWKFPEFKYQLRVSTPTGDYLLSPEWNVTEFAVNYPEALPEVAPATRIMFYKLRWPESSNKVAKMMVLTSTKYKSVPRGDPCDSDIIGRLLPRHAPTPITLAVFTGHNIVADTSDIAPQQMSSLDDVLTKTRNAYTKMLRLGSDRRFVAVTTLHHKYFPTRELCFVTTYVRSRNLPTTGKCRCYRPLLLKTVHKSGPRQGMKFWGCAWGRCRSFRWEVPEAAMAAHDTPTCTC